MMFLHQYVVSCPLENFLKFSITVVKCKISKQILVQKQVELDFCK